MLTKNNLGKLLSEAILESAKNYSHYPAELQAFYMSQTNSPDLEEMCFTAFGDSGAPKMQR